MIDLSGADRARLAPTLSHRPSTGSGWSTFAKVALTCGVMLAATSCSSDDDDDDDEAFVVRSTSHAAASRGTPLLGDGPWLAYLLSEAAQGAGGGTDFNEDGDMLDSIAVRVNTSTRAREVLDVAAQSLHLVRRTMFMVVDEAQDNVDWNMDMDTTDRVLLYLTPNSTTPVYLDDLAGSASTPVVAIGGTVTYQVATAPTVDMETNLRTVTVASNGAAPGMPTMVFATTDPTMDGISFSMRGSDGDIVFLTSDEAVDGDLNGDGDATDANIFGVLDAGADTPEAVCSCLAVGAASKTTAAPVNSGADWLVAFLVDEAAEQTNLNNPALFAGAWQPTNCAASPDSDQSDFVMHWFQLSDLAMGTAAVNTGLVGSDSGTAYALRSSFVGVVSPEAAEGAGGCDLNNDTDMSDAVFRWVDASNPASPPLPVTTSSRLLAVDTSVPGGSGGVVRLSNTWILNVDEDDDSRNHDGDAANDRVLIAAHTPSSGSQSWNFNHGTSAPRPVSVSWMSEDPESASRFFAAFREEPGSIGGGTGDLNGDGDGNDSVPTVPRVFSGNQLTFPGINTATSRSTAGITVEENIGFHRVSEADQGNIDLNGDGDMNDVVLQRFSLVGAFDRALIGTSDTSNGVSVSTGTGNAEFAAFLTEEFLEGADYNGDGDTNDFVVRYLRLPE